MDNKLGLGRSSATRSLASLSITALLALTACNPTPLPQPDYYPTTYQPMVESAAHWQMIAADVWKQISGTLEKNGYKETSIGLESPAEQTQFSKALDGFLFTEAVSHDVSVSPSAQFTLSYTVQIVNYEPLADEQTKSSRTDNDGWNDSATATEMVLTISLTDGNSVRIRQSKVYYIDDADIGLYKTQTTSEQQKIGDSPLVSSNWYSANPHDVEPKARELANTFALMVDPANGPIRSVNAATPIAAAHCAKAGLGGAKYMGESYPTNDRSQIRLTYQCL